MRVLITCQGFSFSWESPVDGDFLIQVSKNIRASTVTSISFLLSLGLLWCTRIGFQKILKLIHSSEGCQCSRKGYVSCPSCYGSVKEFIRKDFPKGIYLWWPSKGGNLWSRFLFHVL
jgi:hypothetical protein